MGRCHSIKPIYSLFNVEMEKFHGCFYYITSHKNSWVDLKVSLTWENSISNVWNECWRSWPKWGCFQLSLSGCGNWGRFLRSGRLQCHFCLWEDLGNYRLVNLSSNPEKVREWTFLEVISKHIENRSVTGNSQHGHKTGKSCFTNLLAFYNKTIGLVGWRKSGGCCFSQF